MFVKLVLQLKAKTQLLCFCAIPLACLNKLCWRRGGGSKAREDRLPIPFATPQLHLCKTNIANVYISRCLNEITYRDLFLSLCIITRFVAGVGSAMLTVAATSILMKSTSYSSNTIVVCITFKFYDVCKYIYPNASI